MNMNRIDPPSWARKPSVQTEAIPQDALVRLHAARDALLSAVHAKVSAYLCNSELVFASPDEFPSSNRLTGEYYIGDESYTFDPATGRYRVSVTARCLAHPLLPGSPPDDYLALEVWLESTTDCQTFTQFRNTDSSVI